MTEPVYADDLVELYHGDARELMPELHGRAGVLITDPPYGTGGGCIGRGGEWSDVAIAGDADTALRDYALELWCATWGDPRPAIVFGSWKQPRPAGVRAVLAWDKGDHVGAGNLGLPWKIDSWEEVYVFGDGFAGHRGPAVLRHNAISPNFVKRDHPTEKPIALMRDLVAKCPPAVILDPFAGAATTLRAAKDLNRRAIGIELEERYIAAAIDRLGQDTLPIDAPAPEALALDL